jgi:F0F1-type ATP synthase assembly protein I
MRRWALAGRLIGIGWYIGLCIVFGVIGGIWVDNKLDTDVIFTLVGLFLGLAAAFLGTYRLLLPLMKEQQGNNKEDN